MKRYNMPYPYGETKTVILANGEFPAHPVALAILNNSKYLVCCDGAINNLAKTNLIPDAIVGDCDSLSEDSLSKFADIIHRISEQETNDLTKAVQFCIKQGKRNITILGATGKREDHTIANISLLCDYMKDADVEMVTDYGVFVAIDSDSIFESEVKQQVSLFSIDKMPLTSHNLAYPINNHVFTNWWQATLNECTDTEFTIETKGRAVVYRAF
ncbi:MULTISPECIES: thiamine diphosphokinase [Dysgonomonas]|nr:MULTISPECIES: thiamine diphosphokinase [Dysgonomonas]MBF0648965.1 thiamine diphosphokinase [Dysgonomonas sp. GY75]